MRLARDQIPIRRVGAEYANDAVSILREAAAWALGRGIVVWHGVARPCRTRLARAPDRVCRSQCAPMRYQLASARYVAWVTFTATLRAAWVQCCRLAADNAAGSPDDPHAAACMRRLCQ